VQGIADEFLLPGSAKPLGLEARFINTYENLSLNGGSVRVLSVIKSDHISHAFMPQKGFIKFRHLLLTYNIDPQFTHISAKQLAKQASDNPAQEYQVEALRARPVVNR
jgi:hypothetical protein